jgi:predicted nucleic acid binding AN1-type Zn finger protein
MAKNYVMLKHLTLVHCLVSSSDKVKSRKKSQRLRKILRKGTPRITEEIKSGVIGGKKVEEPLFQESFVQFAERFRYDI